MKTPEILEQDFAALAENTRTAQAGTSIFSLHLDELGSTAALGFYSEAGRLKGITLALAEIPGAHSADVHFDGNKYTYPTTAADEVQAHIEARRGIEHPPAPYKERRFEESNPQSITARSAAQLIVRAAEADPSGIMFISGAGASRGGSVPLHDHPNLLRSMGASFYDTPEDIKANVAFCNAFMREDGKASEVYTGFDDMLQKFYVDASTPAHCAIAGIVRALDRSPQILTTNHDLKHESSGSRLSATKVPPYWHSENCRSLSEAQRVQEFVEEHRGAINLVVAVGLNRDYRRLLNTLRGDNEQFRVLGINTADKPAPYLSDEDYHIGVDAQVVLPEITHDFLDLSGIK